MHLEKEFLIDTEKTPSGLLTIGSFDVDENGNIFIFDYKSRKIFKFGKKGEYLISFGGGGRWLGVIQSASNIQVSSSGELLVFDVENNKIVIFDKNGLFKREIKIKFRVFNGSMLNNGYFLLKEPCVIDIEKGKMGEKLSLFSHDLIKIKELETIELLGISDRKIDGIRYNISYAVSNNRIFVGNSKRGYEIYVYDLEGNIVKIIKKVYKPVEVSEEYKKDFIEGIKEIYPLIKDKLYFPKYLPPYSSFMADDKGRLYVMIYEKGKGRNEYIFDIFDSEGKFACRQLLKSSSSPRAIAVKLRKERLYCRNEKENGFEELRVYKVIWK